MSFSIVRLPAEAHDSPSLTQGYERRAFMDTNQCPPFQWDQIEAADYRQYVANLRAVGCPEEVLQDILRADLNHQYAERREAIWDPAPAQYWHKACQTCGPMIEDAQRRQLMALEEEKLAILEALLGKSVTVQEFIDLVCLQLHGLEQELLFLPSERQQAAKLALARFARKEERLMNESQDPNGARQQLFPEKLELLGSVLSAAELREYRLRNSTLAQSLRGWLRYFDHSPEEFVRLFDRCEQALNPKQEPLHLGAVFVVEQVRQLLGEERAKELERVSTPFYSNARRRLEEDGLPAARAEEAWQVLESARAALASVSNTPALSPEQKQQQQQGIRREAEAKVIELLGGRRTSSMKQAIQAVLNGK